MSDTDNRFDTADDTDDSSDVEDVFELLAPSLAEKVAGARKALVAAAGVVLQGGAMTGLDGTALSWTQTALGALTAAAVYLVRNVEPAPLWTAADAPAASKRQQDGEPTDAADGYRPEHDKDDPNRQHLPEHAVADEPGPKHEAPDGP